jgi:hypothetical protein
MNRQQLQPTSITSLTRCWLIWSLLQLVSSLSLSTPSQARKANQSILFQSMIDIVLKLAVWAGLDRNDQDSNRWHLGTETNYILLNVNKLDPGHIASNSMVKVDSFLLLSDEFVVCRYRNHLDLFEKFPQTNPKLRSHFLSQHGELLLKERYVTDLTPPLPLRRFLVRIEKILESRQPGNLFLFLGILEYFDLCIE